jgi:hypothetical protein
MVGASFTLIFMLFILFLWPLLLVTLSPKPIDTYLQAVCGAHHHDTSLTFQASAKIDGLTTIISSPNHTHITSGASAYKTSRIYIHDAGNLYLIVDRDIGGKVDKFEAGLAVITSGSIFIKATAVTTVRGVGHHHHYHTEELFLPIWRYASSIADHVRKIGTLTKYASAAGAGGGGRGTNGGGGGGGGGIQQEIQSIYENLPNHRECPECN